jgi:hypothetical protein
VKLKPLHLVICYDDKDVSFKLRNTLMAGGSKLNLVSMNLMSIEQIMVVINSSNFKKFTKRLEMKSLPQSTFVRFKGGTRMYSLMCCPKTYHQ